MKMEYSNGSSTIFAVKGDPIPKYIKRAYNKWWKSIRVKGLVNANPHDLPYIDWYIAKWHPHCLVIYLRRYYRSLKKYVSSGE